MLPRVLRGALSRRLLSTSRPTTRLFSSVVLSWQSKSLDPVVLELPQHLDLMAARLQNGENIYSVLTELATADGNFAAGMRRLSVRLRLGETLDSALETFASEMNSPLCRELANKIRVGVERGTPLAAQVMLLAQSAKNQMRVAQMKAAGKNELRMLVPLVFLILPVTIAFAVFPSLQILQVGL